MAGNNPFRKKAVPQAVIDEINSRMGRNGTLWTAQRFPWVRVTSMSSECSTKFTVLTSAAGALYESTSGASAYQRPLPVVSGLDVKKQGELGTTRKATLKITAFTDNQLRELQRCYFIPGMSVRIEWGWSFGSTGQKVGNIGPGRNFSDTQANSLMKLATKYNPNYEGLQGLVANFTYNLTKDNYWECSVEIVAAAEVFATSKANDYSCPDCVGKQKDEQSGEEKIEKRSTLYTFFYSLKDDFYKAYITYSGLLSKIAAYNDKTINIAQYNFNAADRDENGGEAGGISSWIPNFINQADTTEAFISWATFEAAVNAYSIPTANDTYLFGRIASKNIPLTYHPSVTSADPRVCILPGTISDAPPGPLATQTFGTKPPSCLGPDDAGKACVILDNIMLNTVMLMVELKNVDRSGDGSLRTYLLNVLNRVNEACGGLWEFEVVSTSSDDDAGSEKYPTLTIIDTKKFTPAKDVTFNLPATPLNSVLRDMKLDMKMTDSMKSQALYANSDKQRITKTNAGGGCGSNALKGFRLFGQGEIKNLAFSAKTDQPKCQECKDFNDGQTPPGIGELITNVKDDVTDNTVSALRSFLVAEYAKDIDNGNDGHCDGMILPFEFSFTLDGIGGFAFGQMVACDRIPTEVLEAYNFQVTSVEHSVTPNDWTTTVNTVCRYRTK